jgi:DNA-binding phage protein
METIQKRDKVDAVTDDYRQELLMDLRDPEYAAGYLKAVLQEGEDYHIMLALKDIADAYNLGSSGLTFDAEFVAKVAAGLREHLSKMEEMTTRLEQLRKGNSGADQARLSPS